MSPWLRKRLPRRRFTLIDPEAGWRCRVIDVRGHVDGTVNVTFAVAVPFDPSRAYARLRVTATGVIPVLDVPFRTTRDRALSRLLADTLTDPDRAAHLVAVATRLERAQRRRAAGPGQERHPGALATELRTGTALIAAVADPPEVRAVLLTMLAAAPSRDLAEALTAARAAAA